MTRKAIAAIAAILTLWAQEAQSQKTATLSEMAEPSIFQSRRTADYPLSSFIRWKADDLTFPKDPETATECEPGIFTACPVQDWLEFVDDLSNDPEQEQIRQINWYMNQQRYRTDPSAWRKKEYWASPAEFLEKGGDCEDYAIAKYASLRRLGVKADRMRIVAVRDTVRHIHHAILAIEMPSGDWSILDNTTNAIRSDRRVGHYKPLYSVNEKSWYAHLPPE